MTCHHHANITSWPEAAVCIAILAMFAFMFWLLFKDVNK